jgi:hypothetical protein
MWLTTSLRGMVRLSRTRTSMPKLFCRFQLLGELRVKILNEGVHSGSGSGIVPSSFRILRNLLERIEDSKTGVRSLHAIPCCFRGELMSVCVCAGGPAEGGVR